MTRRRQAADRWVVAAVLVATLHLGSRYALDTPDWQAPDEPAHFNYVAQIAARPGTLPRLEPGEYSQERLADLTARGFPPGESIDDLRYEDYQPPLYYYAALPAYAVGGPETHGRLIAIRWFGAFLGVIAVSLSWCVARAAAPTSPDVAPACAAFVGFLPMRLATASSANNDALAHVLVALALLLSLRYAGRRLSERRFAVLGGLTAAAVVLTKATAYPVLAVMLASAAARRLADEHRREHAGRSLAAAAGMLLPPAMAAALWFGRNVAVYGRGDFLAARAHDRIVIGQPGTAEWIATHGFVPWLERFAAFTFQSFWGVFGWLGVFLDVRIYLLLLVISLIAVAGAAGHLARLLARRDRGAPTERRAAMLLLLQCLLTAGLYIAYNARFVQHQGRYLLVASPAIGTFFCLGLQEAGRRLGRALPPPIGPARVGRAALLAFVVALWLLAHGALDRYVIPALASTR